jgi:hypothetical protein
MNSKNSEEAVYAAVISGEYQVMSDGTVWRVAKRTGNRWKPGTYRTVQVSRRRAEHRLPSNYLQVRLMVKGKRANALAHRLVWRHFNGPIPPGLTINHKSGIRNDNRPSNLELATSSQQQRHMLDILKHGRVLNQRGEMNSMCKLNDAQVAEIRKRRSGGERLISIAQDYGVAFQTISKIALHHRR